MLLAEGKLREAWMYLRPAERKDLLRESIVAAAPDDENIEELVAITFHEGIDVARGFQMILDHYGTCNAITTFEQTTMISGGLSTADQQACVAQLVRQVHHDLLENLRADIEGREGKGLPAETSLAELVAGREHLFGEYSYHIDVSHLGSVVRFARLVEDPDVLRLALDLAEYGRRLHEQFQMRGDEPFVDGFATHGLFFAAQLGQQVDEAVAYFRGRADEVEQYTQGTAAVEIYLALLCRLGRYEEAVAEYIRLVPEGTQLGRLVPSLYELSQRAGRFEQMTELAKSRGDLLGFTTGRIAERLN